MKIRYTSPLKVTLGTLLSAALAAISVLLFSRSTVRGFLPLAFAIVIVLLSRHFGVSVSLTGSLAAALIFSLFLFPPLGSTRVENEHARSSLGWMILLAVSASYLLYPGTPVNRN